MSTKLHYAVAIPTMNRPEELRRCLSCVLVQDPAPREILVVDNGQMNPEEIRSWLGSAGERLVYRRKWPPGSVASMNLAIDLCKSEWLLFLDDDIYLERDFMSRMVDALEAFHWDLGIAGVAGYPICPGKIENRPRARLRAWVERLFLLRGRMEGRFLPSGFLTNYGEGSHPHMPFRVEHVPGGLGLWRSAVLKRNRFDSHYTGYAAGQDQELSYRISRRYRLVCQPRARALHGKSPASRTGRRTLGEMRLRNQVHFFHRHFSARPGAWVCFSWAVFGRLLLQLSSAVAASDSRERFAEFRGMVSALWRRTRAGGETP